MDSDRDGKAGVIHIAYGTQDKMISRVGGEAVDGIGGVESSLGHSAVSDFPSTLHVTGMP